MTSNYFSYRLCCVAQQVPDKAGSLCLVCRTQQQELQPERQAPVER